MRETADRRAGAAPGSGASGAGRAVARLLQDPRAVTLGVVALVSAGLWLALWRTAAMPEMAAPASGMAAMPGMPGMVMPGTMPGWSAGLVLSTAAMWILMTAAMMLPAMAPMLAVYAVIAAKESRGARLAFRVGLFTLGYFLLWVLFSVAAAVAQLALRDSAYFTMSGTVAAPLAAGILLSLAGAWQFTGIKEFCVRHCRHPIGYLMAHWQGGLGGAFPMGVRHGVYCFGCCVAMMGLMFVFGAMNLVWMAVIAAYIVAEKVLPLERFWGQALGGMMMVAGAAMLVKAGF